MRANPEVKLSGDRNECPGCGKLFNSTFAFDKHRIGKFGKDRRCMTGTEMVAAGMDVNAAGFLVSAHREAAYGF